MEEAEIGGVNFLFSGIKGTNNSIRFPVFTTGIFSLLNIFMDMNSWNCFFCKEFPRKKKACNGGMGSQRVEGGMCGCDGREKCREEIALPKNGSQ
jgi:hypothetical protein